MSHPAIDTNAFAEMKELMEESFNDIIEMTLQTLPQQLDGIKTAIENMDVDTLFNISHRMKSSCGSIGAFGLAKKAEAIELISREGSAEISDLLFSELYDTTHQVLSFLENELNGPISTK